jgi:hypothetical protein
VKSGSVCKPLHPTPPPTPTVPLRCVFNCLSNYIQKIQKFKSHTTKNKRRGKYNAFSYLFIVTVPVKSQIVKIYIFEQIEKNLCAD